MRFSGFALYSGRLRFLSVSHRFRGGSINRLSTPGAGHAPFLLIQSLLPSRYAFVYGILFVRVYPSQGDPTHSSNPYGRQHHKMISSIHTGTVIPFQIVSRDPTPCRKSAHFHDRANLEPVSDPLQISLRFFQLSSTRIPIGQPCSQLSFRRRKDTGLPSSTFNTQWVSVCLSAGGIIDYVK